MSAAMSVSITNWLNTEVPAVMKEALIESVEQNKERVLSEQAARSGGIEPTLRMMIVDGKHNASEADIKADSTVVLDWNYLTEAVIKTVEYLREHGPERTGEWKRSVIVLVNGREQPVTEPIPADVEQATVTINVPYARRLEIGRTRSGRAFAIEVPQHYVEGSTLRLRPQLRDLAELSFNYIDLAGAPTSASRRARGRKDTTIRYPAIIIDEIEAVA